VGTMRANQWSSVNGRRLSSGRRFLKFVIVYDNHCQTRTASACVVCIFFRVSSMNVLRISGFKTDIII
jgi:hypothetical protein